MCPDRIIRRFAGLFILASITLAMLVDPRFYWFTAFVGLNLLQSSVTNFCPLEKALGYFGVAGCKREA
ncbi:MAG: YgaP family membrane protein [Gemmatimonadaceae bacterium]